MFRRIHAVHLEDMLRQINANSDNLVHGRPPSLGSKLKLGTFDAVRGPSTPTRLGSIAAKQDV
ncbi:MAG: hypothetical protein ACREDP_19135, partial [Bradyrhizobium sp.]